MDFGFKDDSSSILIWLDDSLNDYFYVSGTKLLVSGSTNITRDVSFRYAAVTCVGISGNFPVSKCLYAQCTVSKYHFVLYDETIHGPFYFYKRNIFRVFSF